MAESKLETLDVNATTAVETSIDAGRPAVGSAFSGIFPDPIWPSETMGELLELGFRADHLIDALDHPVVKRLRGIPT